MHHRRRRLQRWGATATAALSTALSAACGAPGSNAAPAPTAGYPVTLHAANGIVQLATRPTAIVSLSPTATDFASRWGSRIVDLLRVVATVVDTSSVPAPTSSR